MAGFPSRSRWAPDPASPRPLAGAGQRRGPLPRPVRLHRLTPGRRRGPAAVPATLRRIRQHLGLCHLPGQQGRLRRLRPTQRTARRQPRRRPRLRLRPVPQRPHRLATGYNTDEPTGRTTSPGPCPAGAPLEGLGHPTRPVWRGAASCSAQHPPDLATRAWAEPAVGAVRSAGCRMTSGSPRCGLPAGVGLW
jgi:hypothetical protein